MFIKFIIKESRSVKRWLLSRLWTFFNKKIPIYKFYKESTLKSLFLYIYGRKYIKYLKAEKFKILVLTNFHKEIFKEYTNKNTYLMRNYISGGDNQEMIEKDEYILYAGRVSEERSQQLVSNI